MCDLKLSQQIISEDAVIGDGGVSKSADAILLNVHSNTISNLTQSCNQ